MVGVVNSVTVGVSIARMGTSVGDDSVLSEGETEEDDVETGRVSCVVVATHHVDVHS